ncbi:MAG: carboxypeptidase-like regulatory domain-containing protein, partial [Blastocatellia bacterium]
LKKAIIPCLLDETKLPPALAAINGVACRNADEAAPKILAALPREPQPSEAERRAQVIAQLRRVTATEPAAALAQAQALFTQSNLTVGGHLIQGRDVQVTINEGRQHIPIFAIAFAVIAIVALAAFYFISRSGQPSPQPVPSPTVEEMSKLGGQVDDADGNPVSGATVKIDEINGKPQMKTTTTGNGGFIIDKIPARDGVRARVYVSKEGYETHDQYVALPGPLNVKLRRKR